MSFKLPCIELSVPRPISAKSFWFDDKSDASFSRYSKRRDKGTQWTTNIEHLLVRHGSKHQKKVFMQIEIKRKIVPAENTIRKKQCNVFIILVDALELLCIMKVVCIN